MHQKGDGYHGRLVSIRRGVLFSLYSDGPKKNIWCHHCKMCLIGHDGSAFLLLHFKCVVRGYKPQCIYRPPVLRLRHIKAVSIAGYVLVSLSASIHMIAAFQAIHCSLNVPLHLVPICSPLGIFINLFGPEDTAEPVSIRDDGRHLLGVLRIDEVDLAELTQGLEVLEKIIVPQSPNVLESRDSCQQSA